MFSFLYILLRRVIILKLLNDYLKNNYPEYYNYILYNTSYNAIFIFSKGQILLNKTVRHIKNVVESNTVIKSLFEKINKTVISSSYSKIEYIKNGQIVKKCYKHEFNENDANFKEVDFILYTEYEKDSYESLNKKIINPSKFVDFNYELSNIKFILIELYLNAKTYTVDLKTNNHNYYLVDNIIDIHFIKYYLIFYHSLNISMEEIETKRICDDFFIRIIDQNVNIIKINMKLESIQINKNDYTIIQN